MARTTRANMELVADIDATVDDTVIDAFITTANELVTECCSDSGYTSTRLELIERWLSCHFYQIQEQPALSEKAGSVSVRYMSKVDLHLKLTHYGQQALLLDTKGGLAQLNERMTKGKSATASVLYAGKTRRDVAGY